MCIFCVCVCMCVCVCEWVRITVPCKLQDCLIHGFLYYAGSQQLFFELKNIFCSEYYCLLWCSKFSHESNLDFRVMTESVILIQYLFAGLSVLVPVVTSGLFCFLRFDGVAIALPRLPRALDSPNFLFLSSGWHSSTLLFLFFDPIVLQMTF